LSRVINPESAGKERTRLIKCIVLALRELMQQTEPNSASKDLAAFIAIALQEIHDSIDSSVNAWEKRGYWVKADRFRMEWEWTGRVSRAMKNALLGEDWGGVAGQSALIMQKFFTVQVPARHRLGTPWVGAYQRFLNESKNE